MVLQDLLKRVLSGKDEYGDNWLAMRHKLLSIYGEALSSTCTRLVQMIQVVIFFSFPFILAYYILIVNIIVMDLLLKETTSVL